MTFHAVRVNKQKKKKDLNRQDVVIKNKKVKIQVVIKIKKKKIVFFFFQHSGTKISNKSQRTAQHNESTSTRTGFWSEINGKDLLNRKTAWHQWESILSAGSRIAEEVWVRVLTGNGTIVSDRINDGKDYVQSWWWSWCP